MFWSAFSQGRIDPRQSGRGRANDESLTASTPNLLATRFQPGQSGNPVTRFQPGQSGNPQGSRAKCRYKLSEAFIRQLWLDFEEHGADAIKAVRQRRPQDYLKIIASLIPRQEDGDEGRFVIGNVIFRMGDGTDVVRSRGACLDGSPLEPGSDC